MFYLLGYHPQYGAAWDGMRFLSNICFPRSYTVLEPSSHEWFQKSVLRYFCRIRRPRSYPKPLEIHWGLQFSSQYDFSTDFSISILKLCSCECEILSIWIQLESWLLCLFPFLSRQNVTKRRHCIENILLKVGGKWRWLVTLYHKAANTLHFNTGHHYP